MLELESVNKNIQGYTQEEEVDELGLFTGEEMMEIFRKKKEEDDREYLEVLQYIIDELV